MNYIEQIKAFWLLDKVYSFSGNETRLYFYLLEQSNLLYWKNPLANADGYTAGVVGISINTLKTLRNKLQQAGLIRFKSGGKGARDKSLYELLAADEIISKVSNKVSKFDTLSSEKLTPYLYPYGEKVDDNNKLKHKLKKEESPLPPFFEKSESFGSVESPEKELLPLSTEGEEKEKSCGQKEKEEQGDLKPSSGLDGDLWHDSAQERRSVTEASSDFKTAPETEGQPVKAVQEAKAGFSRAPHKQKLFGELRYPFDSEKFTKAWALWKRYKGEEHGFKYKSALSEQMALNALHKLSQGKEAGALSIIEQSMANGWEGLFELKNPGREQGGYPSALEKLRSDQILFEGFAMKYVSQLTKTDFEHFCRQWDLSQESQGGWEEKGKRQLLAGLEKYLNTIIYRKKREEKTTDHNAIDIKKSTIRKLG